jgi:hypothetical protein
VSDLVTTADLRARVLRDTGFEGDGFADAVGLTDDILRTARAFQDELFSIGQLYYRSSVTISTVNNQSVYTLPADFYKVKLVSVQGRSGTWGRAQQIDDADVPDALNAGVNGYADEFYGYVLGGAFGVTPTETIEWLPAPRFVRPFRVDYFPSAVFAISGGEYALRAHGNGWEEYIVADVAARLIEREEGDPTSWLRRKAEALDRIKRTAALRDMSQPTRVTRTADYYGSARNPWDRGRPRPR